MRITGNSIHSSGYSPASQQAIAEARNDRRNDELQQRSTANEEQKRKALQVRGEVVSGVSRDEDLGFRRATASNGADKMFSVYADEERSKLSNSQQKALQAYSDTQNFSRVDADIDYLGSVDIFV